jgi:hypothetical protein
MFDLGNFDNNDMNNCAIALRNMDANAASMEEVAKRMVGYLYENLIDPQTGKSACALVRFFRTYPYRQLNEDLQRSAHEILGWKSIALDTKCLTLLATAGDEPHWNSRHESNGHRAIPLVNREFIERAPMISQLIKQFGLEIATILEPNLELIIDVNQISFNVFYIPEALGSEHIPAQKDFVIPHAIKSVLGFGGMLPSGIFFAIILFSKVPISRKTADLFKWVASYARIATANFDKKIAFTNVLTAFV